MKIRLKITLCLILVFLSLSLTYSQSKKNPLLDSVLRNQHQIIKQLKKNEQNDSLARIPKQDNQKPLWDFAKDLQQDNNQHRQFLQDYYDKIYLTVILILGLFGGLL